MSAQITKLLAVLILAAGALTGLAYSRLQSLRRQAIDSQEDLAVCTRDIATMSPAAPGADLSPASPDDPELNRRLRAAAVFAGISDELASIDPVASRPLRDTDYDETVVLLHFDSASLKQVVTFLHQLGAGDRAMRAKIIEFAPAADAPAPPVATAIDPRELWSVDVTLGCLSFAPHRRAGS